MARIDIKSSNTGGGGGGNLQLLAGASMSATLTAVADTSNTTSPLKLSTTAVQVVSPLRITTDDPSDMYLDCEDGSTNNRFNITRNTASQQVNLNFASNPAGSTTIVGAIRTYVDGVNLSEVMAFREDGQTFVTGNTTIGNGTTAIASRLAIKGSGSTSATTSLLVQNSAGTTALTVKDDLNTIFGGKITLIGTGTIINSFGGFEVSVTGGVNTIDFFNGAFLSTAGQKFLSRPYNSNTRLLTSVLIGADTTQNASAQLQIDSTTQGFLPPRMTDAQRAAISSPAEGLLVYNTDNHAVAYRDGTNWGYLCGALQNQTGSGGTLAISFASGNIVNLTLNASTTLTFAGHVVGTYIIQVTQGGAGSNTLTYPASVKWSGGTAPTLTTTVGKTDILTFYHDGTNFFGTYSLNY